VAYRGNVIPTHDLRGDHASSCALNVCHHEDRWLDLSLPNLAGDWMRRIEERFAGVNGSGPKASKLQSYSSLDKPSTFVTSFFEKYPLATGQLLAHDNESYFLNIAQRSGQKPAPFIPILDNSFKVWFVFLYDV
jgi:enoyl reductase-like protein